MQKKKKITFWIFLVNTKKNKPKLKKDERKQVEKKSIEN